MFPLMILDGSFLGLMQFLHTHELSAFCWVLHGLQIDSTLLCAIFISPVFHPNSSHLHLSQHQLFSSIQRVLSAALWKISQHTKLRKSQNSLLMLQVIKLTRTLSFNIWCPGSWKPLFVIFCLFGFNCFKRARISNPCYSILVTSVSLNTLIERSYAFLNSYETPVHIRKDNSRLFFFWIKISISEETAHIESIEKPLVQDVGYVPI